MPDDARNPVAEPDEAVCVGGPLDGFRLRDTWHLTWQIRSSSTGKVHEYSWDPAARQYTFRRTLDA